MLGAKNAEKKRFPTVVMAICRVNFGSRDTFWHSRGVSAPRAVIRFSQGAACECLGSEEAKKHVRSIPSFLLLCNKTAFSIFRCNSIDFYKEKIPTRGVQGLRQTTNLDTPRGILCSRVPLFAFFIDRIFVASQKKWNRAAIYIF